MTEMGWRHLDGRLLPRLLSLPRYLSRKLAGRSPHVVVRRGASANAAAAGQFVWSRATARNLATTVVTVMTTRNKFMWVHLPIYMLNSCTHCVSCQHINHNAVCLWALQNVFLMWMDSDGTCGYNLIDELFIIENYTFCKNDAF